MSRMDHVTVNNNRVALVRVCESIREAEERMSLISGKVCIIALTDPGEHHQLSGWNTRDSSCWLLATRLRVAGTHVGSFTAHNQPFSAFKPFIKSSQFEFGAGNVVFDWFFGKLQPFTFGEDGGASYNLKSSEARTSIHGLSNVMRVLLRAIP